MQVTAKAQVNSRSEGPGPVSLSFGPDYQDGRNAEWAAATPALSISMTVREGDVADFFEQGGKYTVTFARTED